MEINEIVEKLRSVSNDLDEVKFAEMSFAMFPGWHEGFEDKNEPGIKEAARAILAEGISEDEHNLASYKALAAIVHYIADMLEE
jgi:hypothetical protein